MGGKGRAAEVADLPHPHQIRQRAQGLVDVGIGRWSVDLIEVDVVRAQAAQAVLASRHDPSARVALCVGVLAHDAVHLGGQNDLLPILLGQRLAHDLLGLAERIDIGRVDEVDPRIERAVDDADGLVMVGRSPGPEHHGAQTERAYFDTGAAERAKFHLADGSHGPRPENGRPCPSSRPGPVSRPGPLSAGLWLSLSGGPMHPQPRTGGRARSSWRSNAMQPRSA